MAASGREQRAWRRGAEIAQRVQRQVDVNRVPREKHRTLAPLIVEEAETSGVAAKQEPEEEEEEEKEAEKGRIKLPRGELVFQGKVPTDTCYRNEAGGRRFCVVPCTVKLPRKGKRWRLGGGDGGDDGGAFCDEPAEARGKLVTDVGAGKHSLDLVCTSPFNLCRALVEYGLVKSGAPFVLLSSDNRGLVGTQEVWGVAKVGGRRTVHLCTDPEAYFHMRDAVSDATVYVHRRISPSVSS